MTVGLTDNAFELIRTFYIVFEDGRDDVSPIVARAMQGITELRRTGEPTAALDAGGPDVLADLHHAMRGEARVRTPILLGRMREADPTGTYAGWSARTFKTELEDERGVPIRKSDGQSVIALEDVVAALSRPDEDEE